MATPTDSIYRLYNWYLGRHSFAHLQKGNNPALMVKYPRLPIGLPPADYENQIADIQREQAQ